MTTQTYWWLRKTSIFWLIVTLMVLAACQTEGRTTTGDFVGSWQSDGRDAEQNNTDQVEPTITAEALIGRWQNEGYVIEFKENGTFSVGALDFGTYQLEGALFTWTTDDGASSCFGGQRGTYEVELTDEGQLHWTLREDECFNRADAIHKSLWSRKSP